MSLYARSDMMLVSIPVTSGGCGASHMRPVTHGAPAKVWKLDCAQCEPYLRGDKKDKVIKVIPGDKELNIPSRMEHVADADPHWSSTPEGIPPTPDEQSINKVRAERGHAELQQLQALAALKAAGLTIPDNAAWLLGQTFDSRIIKGAVLCANHHENTNGAKFCSTCGIGMANAENVLPKNPLEAKSIAQLRKECRDSGLSEKGTKAELVKRLTESKLSEV
jgi:SAP domain